MYSALLAIELTLRFRYGLSAYSANSLTIYGIADALLGNYEKAHRFGQLVLLQRIEFRDAECATVGLALTILSFWKEPLQNLSEPLDRVAELGFESGKTLM